MTRPSRWAWAPLLAAGSIALGSPFSAAATPSSLATDEHAACMARLREARTALEAHNRKVPVFNARRADLRALETTLNAAQSRIDATDGEAIRAHNAQVESAEAQWVEWVLLKAELRVLAADVRLGEAWWKRTCAGRWPTSAEPSGEVAPGACDATGAADDIERQLEASMTALREEQRKHMQAVDRAVAERGATQGWTTEQRQAVFAKMVTAPGFVSFEREKQPLVMGLLQVIGDGMAAKPAPGSPTTCRLLQRVSKALQGIRDVNARQFAWMAAEVKRAR